MANNSSKRVGRAPVDLTIHPAPDLYTPPGVPPAQEWVYPVSFGDDDKIIYRQRVYQSKVVDFAIQQMTRIGSTWAEVARIDCCHSTIHRHQFSSAGDDRRTPIIPIPSQGWSVVDEAFTRCCDLMEDEWDDNLRRWNQRVRRD